MNSAYRHDSMAQSAGYRTHLILNKKNRKPASEATQLREEGWRGLYCVLAGLIICGAAVP